MKLQLLEQTIKKYLPADKIRNEDTKTQEEESREKTPGGGSSIRERLEKIEGLNYETAISYIGNDEELLQEIDIEQ